jgi:hypothetical protein
LINQSFSMPAKSKTIPQKSKKGGARPGSGRRPLHVEADLQALMDTAWPDADRRAVVRALHEKALNGSVAAATALLDRALGKPIERQMQTIQRVSRTYNDAPVVLDCTGAGDPIFEGLRDRDVPVIPFKFSSSSKEQLINNLAMRIEQNEARLMNLPVQTGELRAYEYQTSKSGNLKMSAPEGQHDDCVCALGLSYWGLKSRMNWEWD